MLYRQTGDFANAEIAYDRARGLMKQLPIGSPIISVVDHNLGELYLTMGRLGPAKALYAQILEDRLKAYPPDHPEVAQAKNSLGSVYQSLKEFDRAEALYNDALKNLKQRQHVTRFVVLNNLATLAADRGNERKAYELYRDLLDLVESHYPPEHPNVIQARQNWFSASFAAGEMQEAVKLSREFLNNARQELNDSMQYQSEREQIHSLNALRGHLDNFLSAAKAADVSPDEVYQEVLGWKGSVTLKLEMQHALRLGTAEGDKSDGFLRKVIELQQIAQELERLYLTPPQPVLRLRQERRDKIEKLTAKRDECEKDLARLNPAYAMVKQQKPTEVKNLMAALTATKTDAVLLDILEHQFLVPPSKDAPSHKEDRISIFIVRPGQPVIWVDLGSPKPIEECIEKWRAEIVGGQPTATTSEEIRKCISSKVADHIHGSKLVFVSSDGALSRLPFVALPSNQEGKLLIEEHLFVAIPIPAKLPAILNAARNHGEIPNRLLLVGGVDYDAEIDETAPATAKFLPKQTLRPSRFSPLVNTLTEVGTAGRIFRTAYPDSEVQYLTKEKATRSAYVSHAKRYAWQIVATHGFFASPEVDAQTSPLFVGKLLSSAADDASLWNPGVMSGLVFAGANNNHEQSEASLLTAMSIAELDLHGVELVILSACESALGEAAGGEGLRGLERAFHVAGAKTCVASLWSVHDAGTRILMERFYENLWQKNMGKLEALHEAQIWILRHPVEFYGKFTAKEKQTAVDRQRGLGLPPLNEQFNGTSTPPYFWAAFGLSGDWR